MRMARARSVRDDFGNEAEAANGALGISSRTRADWGRARRSAISAPPPPMLRAVANSRNSLPLSSRLRTNTGIAKGRRSHLRSSRSALFWLKPATFPCGLDTLSTGTSWAKPKNLITAAASHPTKAGRLLQFNPGNGFSRGEKANLSFYLWYFLRF